MPAILHDAPASPKRGQIPHPVFTGASQPACLLDNNCTHCTDLWLSSGPGLPWPEDPSEAIEDGAKKAGWGSEVGGYWPRPWLAIPRFGMPSI